MDRDNPSLFLSSRHVGDWASSSTQMFVVSLFENEEHCYSSFTCLFVLHLRVVAICHEPSPLLASRHGSGLLDMYGQLNFCVLTFLRVQYHTVKESLNFRGEHHKTITLPTPVPILDVLKPTCMVCHKKKQKQNKPTENTWYFPWPCAQPGKNLVCFYFQLSRTHQSTKEIAPSPAQNMQQTLNIVQVQVQCTLG